MKTKIYKVYEFKELDKDAKKFAIDKWYEEEDYPFLISDLKENIQLLDIINIFENTQISYSLNNCQGDGLSFRANINLEKWLAYKKINHKKTKEIREEVYNILSEGNTYRRYCYASKNDITWEGQGNESEKTKKFMDKTCAEIGDYYLKICKKVETIGYKILEYRMQESEFQEMCELNKYEFLADGKMD